MSTLDEWARRWGISADALLDLRRQMGVDNAPRIEATNDASESRQQSLIRLDAAANGVWLTRNNVGALLDERGVPIRFGLANESKAQNLAVKSADLIGIRPVLIGPHHVGQTIGQFASVECKKASWHYTGDKHEKAQVAWCEFVLSKGGFACFATGPGIFNQQR